MKTHLLTATALVASTLLAAPAYAAPLASTAALMQGVCDANMRPNDNSKFVTFADITATIPGPEVEASRTEIGRSVHTPGASTVSFGPLHRNGGSPNLFALISTTTTGGKDNVTYAVTYTQDISYQYGCVVEKTTPQGRLSRPPGLQSTGYSTTETITFTRELTLVEDAVGSTAGGTSSEGVVCNNPGPNGGSWTAQNGYTGNCDAEALAFDFSDLNSNSGVGGAGGNDNAGGGNGNGNGGSKNPND